jgi:hypothetical protein
VLAIAEEEGEGCNWEIKSCAYSGWALRAFLIHVEGRARHGLATFPCSTRLR